MSRCIETNFSHRDRGKFWRVKGFVYPEYGYRTAGSGVVCAGKECKRGLYYIDENEKHPQTARAVAAAKVAFFQKGWDVRYAEMAPTKKRPGGKYVKWYCPKCLA